MIVMLDYIYGKPAIVETDHQPLVSILKKPLHTAPARLQRKILKLHKFNLMLVYNKGKELYLAETLSHAPRETKAQHLTEKEDFEVMTVQRISSSCQDELRNHTMEDASLQTLTNIIRHGWPERLSSVPATVKQFFPFWDELSVEDGIIMKGTRTVIPQMLHKENAATQRPSCRRGHQATSTQCGVLDDNDKRHW